MDSRIWVPAGSNLVLHVPSGIYHVNKSVKGKGRLRETTGETAITRARLVAIQKITQWLTGKRAASGRMLISELCTELEAQLDQDFRNGDRRKATAEKDRQYLKTISKHFGHFFVDQIDEQFWRMWIRNEGRALKIRLFDVSKYLSKVLTYAESIGQITRKPTIENPDRVKRSAQVFEPKQIRAFWDAAPLMLKDLIVLGAEVGMRPSETQSLEWGWIVFGTQTLIKLPSSLTKTKVSREIIVSPNAAQVLERRAKESKGSQFVFHPPRTPERPISRQYVYKLMEEMRKTMKLSKGEVKFHWLRHTFASIALLDQKLPLAEVAAYVGNSPGVLFKNYLAKDASRTASVASAVNLNLETKKKS